MDAFVGNNRHGDIGLTLAEPIAAKKVSVSHMCKIFLKQLLYPNLGHNIIVTLRFKYKY
jgi:hypothetical protein